MQDLTIETMSLSVSGNPHHSMAAEEASEGSVDATKAEDNNKVRSMETRLEHLNVATGRFEARAALDAPHQRPLALRDHARRRAGLGPPGVLKCP